MDETNCLKSSRNDKQKAAEINENSARQWNLCLLEFPWKIMKLKIIPTSKVYQQLFILILLLQNSVLGQIDWAEDDDDPGMWKFFLKPRFNEGKSFSEF